MSKQGDSPYSVQGAKQKGNNGVEGSKEKRKVVRSYVRVMTGSHTVKSAYELPVRKSESMAVRCPWLMS